MDTQAFFDELDKIAASAESAKHMKARKSKRPIRVENLLKKSQDPKSSLLMRIMRGSVPLVREHGKSMALLGGGGAAALSGKQALDDWKLGRHIRQAQEQRG